MFDTELFPKCISNPTIRPKVLGRILEWYVIEITVFFAYLFTMLLLMVKSRFKLVGVDQSAQFESFYMSKMANYIINKINFEKHKKKTIELSKESFRNFYS